MTKKRVSATEAADFLNITPRHLRRLVAEGVIDGGEADFDLLATARQYIRHAAKDNEGRQARAELARADAARKTLLLRKQAGDLVSLAELRELSTELWAAVWDAWRLAAANFYGHLALVPSLPHTERLRIAGVCDEMGKAELIQLRERWAKRLRGERAELHDPQRVDKLLAALGGDGETDDD